jgi:hypothetical protein
LLRLDSVRFLANVPPPATLSDLSRAALEALLVELFGKVAALEQLAGEQRDHQGQTTLPRLATLLRSVGVAISKRQLRHRCAPRRQERFLHTDRQ